MPQLSPLKAALAMTATAVVVLGTSRNLDHETIADLVGNGSAAYWLLALLLGVLAYGSVAAAVALWLRFAFGRRPSVEDSQTPALRESRSEPATLRSAKAASLVAAILAAVPIAIWSYWQVFPRHCVEESCLGSGYMWLFFAAIAVFGILVAVAAWAIHLVGGDASAGDRKGGLWLKVLVFDVVLLVAGPMAEDPGGRLVLLVAGLAFIAISVFRRHSIGRRNRLGGA